MYHNYNNSIHSRIDRIYATQNLKVNNINTIPNNLLDHDMISLTIETKKNKKVMVFGNSILLFQNKQISKKLSKTFGKISKKKK